MKTEIIYVKLLDEGTSVYRPVDAIPQGENCFEIISIKDIDEIWEFESNSIVKCEKQQLSGEVVWVALSIKN